MSKKSCNFAAHFYNILLTLKVVPDTDRVTDMDFFSRANRNYRDKEENFPTTVNFFMGVTSAEKEVVDYPIKLYDVFEDYLDVMSKFNQGKFIVLGRKGSGKSAIGEYLYHLASQEANVFCSFIQNSDINLEQLIQIGEEREGKAIKIEMLYKWIVLTNLLKLFLTNEKILASSQVTKYLQQFLERNSGLVEMNKNVIFEIVREQGFSVYTEYLNRAISASGQKLTKTKEGRGEFYQIIPSLEYFVSNIAKSDGENEYVLILDDLDLGFDCKREQSLYNLLELLRVVTKYNLQVFGKQQIPIRIIVLLRTDLAKQLMGADSAKIIIDNSFELTWYEDMYRDNENELYLRRFINKRILENFNKNGIKIWTPQDPWLSFIDESQYHAPKSAFKYIIDHTFYRPRDLIMFFNDLASLKLRIPISQQNIDTILMKNFVRNLFSEIKSELSISYERAPINRLFNDVLSYFGNRERYRDPFGYDEILQKMLEKGVGDQELCERLISDLYEYSLIGNMTESGSVYFRYRETGLDVYAMKKDEKFIMHYALQKYYKLQRA